MIIAQFFRPLGIKDLIGDQFLLYYSQFLFAAVDQVVSTNIKSLKMESHLLILQTAALTFYIHGWMIKKKTITRILEIFDQWILTLDLKYIPRVFEIKCPSAFVIPSPTGVRRGSLLSFGV